MIPRKITRQINLGEEIGSTVGEKQAAHQGQNVQEIKEKEAKEETSKWKASDTELRRSCRRDQRPRRNYSDVVFVNTADSDGERFLGLASSTGLEEDFCMVTIAGEVSTGSGEPNTVKERLQESDGDH